MKRKVPHTIKFLLKNYPARLWRCVAISSLAILSESIGVLSILPIIVMVLGQQNAGMNDSAITRAMEDVFSALSLPVTLPVLLSAFLAGILLKTALNLLAIQQAGYAAAKVSRDIRTELTSGLMHASWPHFINLRIGEMTNLLVGEPDRIAYAFPAFVKFLSAIFQVILYTTLSFYASPAVAIAAFVIGGIVFLCLRRLITIHQYACTEQAQGRNALADHITQFLNGFKAIKAMGLEPWVQPILDQKSERLGHLYRKEVLTKAAMQSVFEPTFAICLCLGIVMFTIVYPQPIAQLMFMAVLLHRLMSHMSTLQTSYQNLTGYDGIIEQYFKHKNSILSAAEATRTHEKLPKWEIISLRNVSFAYGATPIINNIDMTFPATGLTVVLGPSGTGKSTLLDILAGLHKPTSGHLFIDEASLSYDHIHVYRERLGYLPQEPVLLNDTIRTNITLGDPRFSDADITAALEHADLLKTISAFPDGIETMAGERGSRLSGGQRQRLMLARALIRKPAMLLLDEPLSALDADTALALCRTLERLKKHICIIAVSHQKDILNVADHVYEMHTGSLLKND